MDKKTSHPDIKRLLFRIPAVNRIYPEEDPITRPISSSFESADSLDTGSASNSRSKRSSTPDASDHTIFRLNLVPDAETPRESFSSVTARSVNSIGLLDLSTPRSSILTPPEPGPGPPPAPAGDQKRRKSISDCSCAVEVEVGAEKLVPPNPAPRRKSIGAAISAAVSSIVSPPPPPAPAPVVDQATRRQSIPALALDKLRSIFAGKSARETVGVRGESQRGSVGSYGSSARVSAEQMAPNNTFHLKQERDKGAIDEDPACNALWYKLHCDKIFLCGVKQNADGETPYVTENHRWARVVTIIAVICVLGVVIAMIVRLTDSSSS